MKKFLCILLIASLLFSVLSPIISATEYGRSVKELLSMTDAESVDFVKSNGVKLPDDYEDEYIWGSFIKATISYVINNPNAIFSYGYKPTDDLANDVKKLVLSYLGTTASSLGNRNSDYVLQDSTVVGEWNDSFENYNCYAYALGLTTFRNAAPGFYSGGEFSMSLSMSEIANLVENDLRAFGWVCVYTTPNKPNVSTLAPHHEVMCVRKGTALFHFMKYSGDAWYHKPGATHILRYNYEPSNDRVWLNEYSIRGIAYPPIIVYSGEIYYIIYGNEHSDECGCGDLVRSNANQ